MTGEYLTIEQICERLKITRQTVSKYIASGELKAIKVNKRYRIPLESFLSFTKTDLCVSSSPSIYSMLSRNCSLVYKDKYQADLLDISLSRNKKIKKIYGHDESLINSLFIGDNKSILDFLLPTNKETIDLIYIDPPFGTGQQFLFHNEEHAYDDTLINHEFLEFLRIRFVQLKELLSDQGSIYVHIDKKIGHYVKIIMDEVFGYKNYINDITRIKCNPKNFNRKAYGNFSDMILFYAKHAGNQIWNDVRENLSNNQLERLYPRIHPEKGRFTTNPLHAPGITRDGDTGERWNGMLPPQGRHWRYSRKELDRLNDEGLIEWSSTGNPRKIVYANEHNGVKIQDVWEFKDAGLTNSLYPTQKNYDLLDRIIKNSSKKNSIVLDCFSGSGTTLLAAAKNSRSYIGIDKSRKAINIAQGLLNNNGFYPNIYELVD